MGVPLDRDVINAINKFAETPMGRKYGRWAKANHGISGKKLMAKTVAGENGGRGIKKSRRLNIRSSAGAFGPAQFIPSTRQAYIQQHGVDPWRDDFSAMKGMAIHHMGTGVAGYNPGMPTYTSYILGQKVDKGSLQALRSGGTKARFKRQKGRGGRETLTDTVRTPGVDNSALRQQALLSYLDQRGRPGALLGLKSALDSAQDIPGSVTTKTTTRPGRRPHKRPEGGPSSKAGIPFRRDQNHGAKAIAEYATKGVYGSGERSPSQNAAVGGAPGSDHLTTNRMASAVDAKYGSGRQAAKRLGIKNWRPGTYDRHEITVKGRKYSVQILENVAGHYDHTHVGVQRVG